MREIKNTFKRLHINNGSVTVDAAISFPIFILGVILIVSLINQALAEDSVYRKLSEEANVSLSAVSLLDMDIPYMIAFGKTPKNNVNIELYYRPFLGESEDTRASNVKVYVYPNMGKRYHVKSCSTLDHNSNYVLMTQKEAVDKGYTPCLLCCPGGTDYFKKREAISMPLF